MDAFHDLNQLRESPSEERFDAPPDHHDGYCREEKRDDLRDAQGPVLANIVYYLLGEEERCPDHEQVHEEGRERDGEAVEVGEHEECRKGRGPRDKGRADRDYADPWSGQYVQVAPGGVHDIDYGDREEDEPARYLEVGYRDAEGEEYRPADHEECYCDCRCRQDRVEEHDPLLPRVHAPGHRVVNRYDAYGLHGNEQGYEGKEEALYESGGKVHWVIIPDKDILRKAVEPASCARKKGMPARSAGQALVRPWFSPLFLDFFAEALLDALELRGQAVLGLAGPDVELNGAGHAGRFLQYLLVAFLHERHYVVPAALDDGAHRVCLVGQAALLHDLQHARYRIPHALAGPQRDDAELRKHLILLLPPEKRRRGARRDEISALFSEYSRLTEEVCWMGGLEIHPVYHRGAPGAPGVFDDVLFDDKAAALDQKLAAAVAVGGLSLAVRDVARVDVPEPLIDAYIPRPLKGLKGRAGYVHQLVRRVEGAYVPRHGDVGPGYPLSYLLQFPVAVVHSRDEEGRYLHPDTACPQAPYGFQTRGKGRTTDLLVEGFAE